MKFFGQKNEIAQLIELHGVHLSVLCEPETIFGYQGCGRTPTAQISSRRQRPLICFIYLYGSQLKLTQSDAGVVIVLRLLLPVPWVHRIGHEGQEGFCQSRLRDMVASRASEAAALFK
jgi:hypothetical protein